MPTQTLQENLTSPEPVPVRVVPFERPRLLVSWQAPARAFRQKADAYLATVAITALMLALIIWFAFGDFILSLLVLSLGLVLYAVNKFEPPLTDYGIYTTHVALDDKKYFYRDLKWFWFSRVEEPGDGKKVVFISTYLNMPPRLLLVVPDEVSEQTQEALLKYLSYHEERESDLMKYIDQILNLLAPRLPDSVVALFKRVEDGAPRALRRT